MKLEKLAAIAALALGCASSMAATYEIPISGTWVYSDDTDPYCDTCTYSYAESGFVTVTAPDGDGTFSDDVSVSYAWSGHGDYALYVDSADADYLSVTVANGEVTALTGNELQYFVGLTTITSPDSLVFQADLGTVHLAATLDGTLALASVPEAPSAILMLGSLALLPFARRRLSTHRSAA